MHANAPYVYGNIPVDTCVLYLYMSSYKHFTTNYVLSQMVTLNGNIEFDKGERGGIEWGKEVRMETVIIENVRGRWIVDKSTTGVFQEKGIGYGDGALIELEIANHKSLCCHPDSPTLCTQMKEIANKYIKPKEGL